jgi:lipopolysaccharide/colanic/teichoic acid biosynthesis glycosyltransferase
VTIRVSLASAGGCGATRSTSCRSSINVLRGQMSLVGPRPLPQRDYDRLEDWHMKRYLVLPGMTGLWQVSGRAELSFDDLVRLDFLYLERWSVFLDLTILAKTLPAVIWGRGAF